MVYRLVEMVVGRLHEQFPLSSTLSLLNLEFKKGLKTTVSWKPSNSPSKLPAWVPLRLRTVIRWCFKWGLVGFSVLVAFALFYFYLALKFDLSDVAQMPERSVILDRHGVEFAAIHGERRRLITREEIPDAMIYALLAREDLRFPDHHGIDVRGLARATVRNIKDMSFTQGASTLTMQLTRNTYEMRAKSLHRKLLEMAVTLRIESRYSKDEILTHYLNRIYFGAGCHGVEEASQTYFGRSVTELSTGECALLVGIIRGPHLFSPFRNLEGAKIQRDEVLKRMVICEFVSEEEKIKAMAEPIHLVTVKERKKNSSHMRETIRNQLQIILEQQDIRAGGLRIFTTVDTAMQKSLQSKISRPFPAVEQKNLSELQAAIVSLDPETGGILALCGNRNYASSQYNLAFNARRDLGPAFMPFLTAAALERNKIVIDEQPIQTGRQLGIAETIRLSKRLGFSGPFSETDDLYRGTIAASPIELARAAATLRAGGKQPETYIIVKITDVAGRLLYQRKPSIKQAIREEAADEATEIFFNTSKSFVAVTSSCHDAWAVTSNKKNVSVLWLGHVKPRKIASSRAIEKILTELTLIP